MKSFISRTVNDGCNRSQVYADQFYVGRKARKAHGPVYCELEALAHFAADFLRTLKDRETKAWVVT